jgi:hypothetical protein
MFRLEMPRVYELKDLIDDPYARTAYFQDFDNSLRDGGGSKKKVWLAREHELQQLDADAWLLLKQESLPYLTTCDAKGRGWEQLISILNQARAYNYMVGQGWCGVRFIPPSKKKRLETPDLEGELNGRKVLCEVKTLNISDLEAAKRQTGGGGSTLDLLDDGFLKKLSSTLSKAKSQMESYDNAEIVKHVAFMIINFDDFLGEYKTEYFAQIDRYLAASCLPNIDIIFYNQWTPFHERISMVHAHVVNEPS